MRETLLNVRAGLVSLLILGAFLGVWHIATSGSGAVANMDPEYAKLMGITATQGKSAMPGPAEVGAKIWQHLKDPFYDKGSQYSVPYTVMSRDIGNGPNPQWGSDRLFSGRVGPLGLPVGW